MIAILSLDEELEQLAHEERLKAFREVMREHRQLSWDPRVTEDDGKEWLEINGTQRDRQEPMKKQRGWTAQDERVLRKNYSFETITKIAWLLSGKFTKGAIQNKASIMGLQGHQRARTGVAA